MKPWGLAGRLMAAQVVIVAVGIACLSATAAAVAPRVFSDHLAQAGERSPSALEHAREAFDWSFFVSIGIAAGVSLAAAALLSWLLASRVGRPVDAMADAARAIAAGNYRTAVPRPAFGRELTDLAESFQRMADRLADTEAARNRVMADFAHELRTPLATLEAQLEAVEDGVVPADSEAYGVMGEQVDRIRRLAEDVRQVSAAQEGGLDIRPEDVELASLVASAVDGARVRYRAKGVRLEVADMADDPVLVRVDPQRLGQVLGNLLDNALRNTPPDGTVIVSLRLSRGSVLISVSDTGCGISSDELTLIFERFHQVDVSRAATTGRGSGLGLTIARAIVNAHGGALTAESAGLGKGASFTVTLPISS